MKKTSILSILVQNIWAAVSLIGLLLVFVAWAFASPVGSTPDEDFHLVSIWCSDSQNNAYCKQTNDEQVREVNIGLLRSACFAGQSDVSAKCQISGNLFHTEITEITSRGNFAGNYPPGFYKVMSLFAGKDIEASVITMRIFNLALFSGVITLIWLLVSKPQRKALYLTALITMVPLGIFLIPSINPSSWAITAAFTCFFATAGAINSKKQKRVALWALVIFGLLIAGGSRYDGLLYAIVSCISAFVISSKFTVNKKWFFGFLITFLVLTAVFFFIGGDGFLEKLANLAGNGTNRDSGAGFVGVLFFNLSQLPQLFAGFSGAMGLGWLDTAMPPSSWMPAAFVLWTVLFLYFGFLKKRRITVSIILLALLICIPLIVLQMNMATVGQNVQSRYLYPLLIVLVASILYSSKSSKPKLSAIQFVFISFCLFVSQALAITFNLERYISAGTKNSGWNLNEAASSSWWWEMGPNPLTVVGLSTLGFLMFLLLGFVDNSQFFSSKINSLKSKNETFQ